MMRSVLFFLIMAMLTTASHANMRKIKPIQSAMIDTLLKRYKRSNFKIEKELDAYKLNVIEDIVAAHQMLSLNYCELKNTPRMEEHLEALNAFSETANFNMFNPTPECKEKLNTLLNKLRKKRR